MRVVLKTPDGADEVRDLTAFVVEVSDWRLEVSQDADAAPPPPRPEQRRAVLQLRRPPPLCEHDDAGTTGAGTL
jgi:hypothetical protein